MVVTLDTFRADRLGAYGSRRGLTPHLDRFAEEGVVFETTDSVAPLTLPAHASLFTGRFPPGHGVHENAGVLGDGRGGDTLAEVLARSGFRTGAFVAATVLDASRGLNRGFSHYDAVRPASGRVRSPARPASRRRGRRARNPVARCRGGLALLCVAARLRRARAVRRRLLPIATRTVTRTRERSRTSTRKSANCSKSSSGADCSTARLSWSSAITARASAITVSGRMGSSSTRACCTCR